MLADKELLCAENWKGGTSSSKKAAQCIAKKLQNYEIVPMKNVTERNR